MVRISFKIQLRHLIQAWDLTDFKRKKGRYTWSNNQIGAANIATCLDRFLVNSSLMDENVVISSKIMPKLTSNLHPITLSQEKEGNLDPIPFRFSPLWIERDGFKDTVYHAWSQYVVGSPSFVWEQKLKKTRYALKNWIKNPQNTPLSDKQKEVFELAKFQFEMEECDITKAHLVLEQSAQLNSLQSFRQEEEFLRLKS